MNFEFHCKASKKKFGERYEEVHRWLDEFSKDYPERENYKHRKHRHHREGIEEARKLFGDIGAEVAEHHIWLDMAKIPSKADYDNDPRYAD